MKDYLGQILSIVCVKKNIFNVKILIERAENFERIFSSYDHNLMDQFNTFDIKVEIADDSELLITPDDLASDYLEIYSSIEPDSPELTDVNDEWKIGMILDNLIYDTVNSLIYRPVSTKELELEEFEEYEEEDNSPF